MFYMYWGLYSQYLSILPSIQPSKLLTVRICNYNGNGYDWDPLLVNIEEKSDDHDNHDDDDNNMFESILSFFDFLPTLLEGV